MTVKGNADKMPMTEAALEEFIQTIERGELDASGFTATEHFIESDYAKFYHSGFGDYMTLKIAGTEFVLNQEQWDRMSPFFDAIRSNQFKRVMSELKAESARGE